MRVIRDAVKEAQCIKGKIVWKNKGKHDCNEKYFSAMDRIQLMHPEGKKCPSMDKSKYDTLRASFLFCFKKVKHASFDELLAIVAEDLKKKKIKVEGKLEWNLFWVSLDLESKGEISKDRTSSPIQYSLPKLTG